MCVCVWVFLLFSSLSLIFSFLSHPNTFPPPFLPISLNTISLSSLQFLTPILSFPFPLRYGHGRANDDLKDWLIPAKATDDGTVDPWAKRRSEKKERVAKGVKQQMQNMNKAQKFLTLSSSSSTAPASSSAKAEKKKRELSSKSNLDRALVTTRRSTASAGKFQKKLDREPRERHVYHKRDALTPSSNASEKERSQKVVERILKKGSVIDVDKAVSVHKLQKERERRMAKERDGGGEGRKGREGREGREGRKGRKEKEVRSVCV